MSLLKRRLVQLRTTPTVESLMCVYVCVCACARAWVKKKGLSKGDRRNSSLSLSGRDLNR